jgi:hypothetical protein
MVFMEVCMMPWKNGLYGTVDSLTSITSKSLPEGAEMDRREGVLLAGIGETLLRLLVLLVIFMDLIDLDKELARNIVGVDMFDVDKGVSKSL